MAKILLVEDDSSAVQFVSSWLTAERHIVEIARDGADGLEFMLMTEFDVILLDWDLPSMSGHDVLKQFRAKGFTTPVIMLTAKSDIDSKEAGLDGGADDYLTKPFALMELSARIRVQLRKTNKQSQNKLVSGDIVVIPDQLRVTRAGREIELLPKEFSLFEFFVRNPDRVFSAEAIMQRVWQSETDATTDAFRSCLKRLRQKIALPNEEKPIIETVHGAGYRFNSQP
jgi:two-component system OmpR family response regulator